MFTFFSCGLPNPFDFTPSTPPFVSSRLNSNGTAVTLQLTGPFTQENYPKLEGFNIYFSDNNDPNEIGKRILYISDSDKLPSVSFLWKNITSSQTFSYDVTLPSSPQFRLTESAEAVDLIDEAVSSTDTLIKNSAQWNFLEYKKFYFNVRSVVSGQESSASSTVLVEVPKITTTNVPINSNFSFLQKPSVQSINLYFEKNTTSQKMHFGFTSSGTTALSIVNGNYSVEIYNYGFQENWQNITRPTSSYNNSPEAFANGSLFFISLLNSNNLISYFRIYIENVDTTNVSIVIWEH